MWVGVQGVEILAGVLLCAPLKVKLELLAGSHNALLGLVLAQVLLLDELQLLLLLPLAGPAPAPDSHMGD